MAFGPYLTVGVVHVIALAVHAELLASVTKPLLMPLLALALWLVVRTWSTPLLLTFGALAFSWFGDVVPIVVHDSTIVMIGLFLVAHIFYLVLFLRYLSVRRLPWWSAVYALWWIGLMVLLAPKTGTLLIPVAVYGLVLGAVAAAATRSTPIVAWGAALFLVSDSLLAIRLFAPELNPLRTIDDPLIMAFYIVGQGLIVYGVSQFLTSRESGSARRSSRNSSAA